MKFYQKRSLIIIPVLLAAAILSGCELDGIKARKPAGDFSRGLPLPVEAISLPAVVVDDEGSTIQMLIPTSDAENEIVLRYFQIDDLAKIVLDQEISIDLGFLSRSFMMIPAGDQNHLVWASRENSQQGWGLWHAMLNSRGEITSQPKWISQGTDWVSQYEIAEDGKGGALILWEDSNQTSILYTHLSSQGEITTPPSLLIPFGERPSLAPDDRGGFHLAWMQGENLVYSKLVSDFSSPILGDKLTRVQVAKGNRLDGPAIGTSGSHVTIFWSILRQRGLEAGTAITEYLVFSEGQTTQNRRGLVTAYPASDDLFGPYQGSLSLTQIISPPREDYLSTNYIYDPRTSPGHDGVLVVAVAANQKIRLDQHVQILVGIFEGGEYQGYTIGTRTTEISRDPQIVMDKNGDLHLTWQEGSAGKRTFYATTAPTARESLDQFSLGDLPNLFLSGGLEAITGMLLFPFAFPWMVVGLVILIVLRLTRNDENVTQPLSKILLIIAILTYQVSKLLFLPDLLVYIPFSAWLDLSEGAGQIMRILVPVTIFGLGILVAELRRRRNPAPPSSLSYFITVILVDTLLTLSVYGVIFLGEY